MYSEEVQPRNRWTTPEHPEGTLRSGRLQGTVAWLLGC